MKTKPTVWWQAATWSILLLFALTGIVSCQDKEDEDLSPASTSGFYRINTIKSDAVVDLNRDGIASADFMTEAQPYDFSFPVSGLVVRPYADTDQVKDQVYLTIPSQNYWPSDPSMPLTFSKMGFEYKYTYNPKSKNIPLTSLLVGLGINIQEVEDQNGKLQSLSLVSDNQIQAVVTKGYFDFKSQAWKKLNLTVLATKVP